MCVCVQRWLKQYSEEVTTHADKENKAVNQKTSRKTGDYIHTCMYMYMYTDYIHVYMYRAPV